MNEVETLLGPVDLETAIESPTPPQAAASRQISAPRSAASSLARGFTAPSAARNSLPPVRNSLTPRPQAQPKRKRADRPSSSTPIVIEDSETDGDGKSKAVAPFKRSSPIPHDFRFSGPFSELTDASTDQELDDMLEKAQAWTYLPDCSVIVKLPKKEGWIELQCVECKGNYSEINGALLKGCIAMSTHMNKAHDYEKLGYPKIAEHCGVRSVEKEELREILRGGSAGGPYVDIRPVKGTPSNRGEGTKRTNEHAADWNLVKDSSNYLSACPVIVKHPDGYWAELACPVCKGNATKRGAFLADGVKSFYDHLNHAHGEPRMTTGPRSIIERCLVKRMKEEEVLLIKAGKASMPQGKVVESTAAPAKKSAVVQPQADEPENDTPSTRSFNKRQKLADRGAAKVGGEDGAGKEDGEEAQQDEADKGNKEHQRYITGLFDVILGTNLAGLKEGEPAEEEE